MFFQYFDSQTSKLQDFQIWFNIPVTYTQSLQVLLYYHWCKQKCITERCSSKKSRLGDAVLPICRLVYLSIHFEELRRCTEVDEQFVHPHFSIRLLFGKKCLNIHKSNTEQENFKQKSVYCWTGRDDVTRSVVLPNCLYGQ